MQKPKLELIHKVITELYRNNIIYNKYKEYKQLELKKTVHKCVFKYSNSFQMQTNDIATHKMQIQKSHHRIIVK